jgi:holo-[acyl-carrier protein] synthase
VDIYCIGTDIIDTARVRKAINRSTKFKDRVFTVSEQEYCEAKGMQKFESYAARYAAKEAVAKSMGTGFGENASLVEIEIVSLPNKPPGIRLYGKARIYKESLKIKRILLSMSAIREYALAYAVSLI